MVYFENYLTFWGIYLASGAGICLVWYQMIKWIKVIEVRLLLLAVLAILLFTPWQGTDPQPFLAPAVVVAAFDFLDGLDKGFAAAVNVALTTLTPMIFALLVASVLAVVSGIVRVMRKKPELQRPEEQPIYTEPTFSEPANSETSFQQSESKSASH